MVTSRQPGVKGFPYNGILKIRASIHNLGSDMRIKSGGRMQFAEKLEVE